MKKMILLIDNYDSFSYNLYQYIGEFDSDIKVVKNDEVTSKDVLTLNPRRIVISPGAGKPSDAGNCIKIIQELHDKFPFLGICLGHQAIFEAFGGTVSYASELMHGKSSTVKIDSSNPLFSGLGDTTTDTITAARYHSLAAVESTIPKELSVIARAIDDKPNDSGKGEIMAICHEKFPVYGLQFHPESVLTPNGKAIIKEFIKRKG